jgi:DNA polymerase elongation subunit (family B)
MSIDSPREIVFKATSWNIEDDKENITLKIHIGGVTRANESVHVIVEGFTPFIYLELPSKVVWNKSKCQSVFEWLKWSMKENAPIKFSTSAKYRLHYNQHVNTMCLYLPNHFSGLMVAKRINESRSKIIIEGVGSFNPGEFIVHEANLDPINKFTAVRKIKLAGWVKVKETIPEDLKGLSPIDRKYSYDDIDCYASFVDVEPFEPPEIWITKQKYLSFDIECYSENHNSKLPDPEARGNKVFSIGSVYGRFGDKNLDKYLFTLGNPHDIEGATVIRCKTESELLLKWVDQILEENPDYFIGYNIMKFDWNYLIKRSDILGIFPQFSKISKIIGQRSVVKEVSWGSSAYGQQIFRYFESVGRTNLDVLIEIERNYKFPKYSLDYVSGEFLKESKDDVTPRQLFMLVKLYDDLYDVIVKAKEKKLKYAGKRKVLIQKRIRDTLILRFCSGEALEMRKKMLKARTFTSLINEVRNTLTTTGRYNIQDCILPIKLCEKLNLQISMEETSNTVHVPMSYLHTRGQGIKVLSQVYRETIFNNYIIPYQRRINDDEKKRYVGAIVAEANPGYYENVACFDFASLYPSSMIALNICYTTLLKNDDPTPDDQCHVLEWEDHQGCEHDKSGKNVHKDDVLCQKHRYRFRKMILHADGTREHEGIMPRMERNLLQSRKVVKKEMEKIEAMIEMSIGKATPDKRAEYISMGWPDVAEGTYSEEELEQMTTQAKILNARQLAIKVAANSGYGILGAQQGYIPLIEGAASVTFTGRTLITQANKYLMERYRGDQSNGEKGRVRMVYGDTDSTMVYFQGCNVPETFDLAEDIAPSISHFLKTMIMKVDETFQVTSTTTGEKWTLNEFPRKRRSELSDSDKIRIYEYDALPISLTFENLYGKYFILTKKRYCAQVVNRKGEWMKDTKKGVVLARRDNSKYLRDTYKELISGIMKKISKDEMFNIVNDRVTALFTRQIPDTHLIIYVGVKGILSYAKTREIKRANGVVKEFVDEDGNPVITDDPLNPRLQYSNVPQVILTLKMLRRGDDVPPNTRLEFLYLEAPPEGVDHQGEKAEDYSYFKENKLALHLHPDYLHYVEKQLARPVGELLSVKFKGDVIPYFTFEKWFEREYMKQTELQRVRISQTKDFTRFATPVKPKPLLLDDDESSSERSEETRRDGAEPLIGWEVICSRCRASETKRCVTHTVNIEPMRYYTKNKSKSLAPLPDAQVEYILSSCRENKVGRKNTIPWGCELQRVCLTYKSMKVINAIRKQKRCRAKLTLKKPTQANARLPVKTKENGATKVVLIENVDGVPTGSFGKLMEIYEEDIPSTLKKGEKRFYYDIKLDKMNEYDDEKILRQVPRNKITTYTRKDDRIVDNILKYRTVYKNVIAELTELFSPFTFKHRSSDEMDGDSADEDC